MKRLGDSNHSQVQLWLLLRQRNSSSIKLDPVSRPLTSSDWLWLFSLYAVDKGEFEWEKQSSCGCCLFFVSYFFRLTKPSCLSRFRAVHLGSWLGLVGKNNQFSCKPTTRWSNLLRCVVGLNLSTFRVHTKENTFSFSSGEDTSSSAVPRKDWPLRSPNMATVYFYIYAIVIW